MTKEFNYRSETETLAAATRASLPGSFVELSDGVVHYEIAGPPDGEIIVLVPGISASYMTWDENFSALANAGCRVLRFDFYGRGYSDRPNVVYNVDLFDRQILELLAALKLTKSITLAGLSMGGAVAATFAARHSECICRLALIDPLVSPPASPALRLLLAPGIGERVFDWFGDEILVGGQLKDFYNPELVSEFQAQYRVPMKYRGFKRAILSTIRNFPVWRIVQAYEQVGKADYAVMLLWGCYDKSIPFEMHRRVLELIPRAEFHAVDDAGHLPHREQPQVFNRLLIEFLKR
ncbi:MAG: alpha/beta hydrolase [Chloroflexi bacterium]|nr:alpha/beta hydrolase [Chloroflexota bacterium]